MESEQAIANAERPLPIRGFVIIGITASLLAWGGWRLVHLGGAEVPAVNNGADRARAFQGWREQILGAVIESDNNWKRVQDLLIQQRSGFEILEFTKVAHKAHRVAEERLEALEGRSPSEMSQQQLGEMDNARLAFIEAVTKRSVFCAWLEAMGEGQKIRPGMVAEMAEDADRLMVIARQRLDVIGANVGNDEVGGAIGASKQQGAE